MRTAAYIVSHFTAGSPLAGGGVGIVTADATIASQQASLA